MALIQDATGDLAFAQILETALLNDLQANTPQGVNSKVALSIRAGDGAQIVGQGGCAVRLAHRGGGRAGAAMVIAPQAVRKRRRFRVILSTPHSFLVILERRVPKPQRGCLTAPKRRHRKRPRHSRPIAQVSCVPSKTARRARLSAIRTSMTCGGILRIRQPTRRHHTIKRDAVCNSHQNQHGHGGFAGPERALDDE